MSSNALAFEVTADSVGFDAAFKRMEKTASGFGSKISGDLKHLAAGAFSYEAFKGLVAHTIDAAKEIRNFSKQADLSTDEVQHLQKAASKVGLEFEDFQAGLSKMGAARKDAATSNQGLLDFFNKWGVSLADLEDPSLRNIDLLTKMSEAMKGVKLTSADRTAFREVFGRGGEKLISAIEALSHLGTVKIMSEEDIEAIYKADRALNQLTKTWKKASAGPIAGAAMMWSNAYNYYFDEKTRKDLDKAQVLRDAFKAKKDTLGEDLYRSYRHELGNGTEETQADALEMLQRYAAGNSLKGRGKLPDDVLSRAGIEPQMFEKQAAAAKSEQDKAKAAAAAKQSDITRDEQARRETAALRESARLTELIWKLNFDMLDPQSQQLALQEKINTGLALAEELKAEGADAAAAGVLEDVAGLNQQLAAMNRPEQQHVPSADSAAAAGGFIGGAVNFNPENFLRRETNNKLDRVIENTKNTVEELKQIKQPGQEPVF